MSIEEIPADEVIVMTSVLHRAFKAGGCAPMCHFCLKDLEIGKHFKLATVEGSTSSNLSHIDYPANYSTTITKEVMLCDVCTAKQYNKRTKKHKAEYEARKAAGGGCYRVNGKIVR